MKACLLIRTIIAALVCNQFSRSLVMTIVIFFIILNPMIFSAFFYDNVKFVYLKELHSFSSFEITFVLTYYDMMLYSFMLNQNVFFAIFHDHNSKFVYR